MFRCWHIFTKPHVILLAFIGLHLHVQAQKELFKEWTAPTFSTLQINSDQISKITLRSHAANVVSIYTRVEGETFDNRLITTNLTQDELTIGTDITPFFEPFNDKLAAHKVVSIEMTILVPEHMRIIIRSQLANVYGFGHFREIDVDLNTGFIQLKSFKGNAILYSKWGSILVEALAGISGSATSVYGKVSNLLEEQGVLQINAASSHGSIMLYQTKN